jgi:negative regulator of flagellin synthesis FlgM
VSHSLYSSNRSIQTCTAVPRTAKPFYLIGVMNVKINDSQRISAYRTYQQQSDTRANQASGKRRTDEVQFSAEAMELLGAQHTDDPNHAQRIESLKKEVSSGTYEVDAGKLAEKLLPFFQPIASKE